MAPQPHELSHIDPDEVSPVRRGAIGKLWALRKSNDGGDVELSKELADVLALPGATEGALLDVLRKGGASESAQEAVVAAVRLLKGFEDELPETLLATVEGLLKGDKAAAADELNPADCATRADLEKAIEKHGDTPADDIKASLIAKATELDAIDALPEAWGVAKSSTRNNDKERGMGDGPSVPVQKADGTWDLSGVDADARPFYETVLKSRDDALERVTKAEATVADLEGRLLEADLTKTASTDLSNIAKSADEVVDVLKAAKNSMSAEDYDKLETLLKSADAQISTGKLFAELGASQDSVIQDAIRKGVTHSASGGDAWEKIVALAKGLVEKSDGDTPLSEEQAVDRVLKTAEGRELYAEYMAETSRGGAA